MAEVLSQSQIDALMKEMRSGGKKKGKEKCSHGPRCVEVRDWEHRGGSRGWPQAEHS